MKVLVCGGRDYLGYPLVSKTLFKLYEEYFTSRAEGEEFVIVQGEAKGADFLAKVWAYTNDFKCVGYTADWKQYGPSAGYIRNKTMLEESRPDVVVAFPGGKGTQSMIKLAQDRGYRIIEV